MYVISVEKLPANRKKKYKVRFDDGTDFVLYEKELRRFEIEENSEFRDEDYEILLKEVFIPRAKKRALFLLQKQDRTRENLKKKLRESGYPMEAVMEAISYTDSYNYTDDERYARNYVRFNQEKKSKRRIRQDMMSKGIDKGIIDDAMEEYSVLEEELIKSIIKKKGYERDKMYRYLLSRGFAPSDIMRQLNMEDEY